MRVNITGTGLIHGTCVALENGELVPGVRRVVFAHEVGGLPRADVELIAGDIAVDADLHTVTVTTFDGRKRVVITSPAAMQIVTDDALEARHQRLAAAEVIARVATQHAA